MTLNKENLQGRLIAFEGLDGSGKSTQLLLVKDYLKKHCPDLQITVTQEPTLLIRDFIKDKFDQLDETAKLYFFIADRIQHFKKVIEPALKLGHLVLCDRYIESTWAYQHTNLSLGEFHNLHKIAGIYYSDLTIYLEIPLVEAQARLISRDIVKDKIECQPQSYWEQVVNRYNQIFNYSDCFCFVDAFQNQDKVLLDIIEILSASSI